MRRNITGILRTVFTDYLTDYLHCMFFFKNLLFVNAFLFVLYNRLCRLLASFRAHVNFSFRVVFSLFCFCFSGLVFTSRVPVGCTVSYDIKCSTEWGSIHLTAHAVNHTTGRPGVSGDTSCGICLWCRRVMDGCFQSTPSRVTSPPRAICTSRQLRYNW